MENGPQTPTEKLLREYLALVEYWALDAGDTHELLGGRELLELRTLTSAQRRQVETADERVLDLADAQHGRGWDVEMLKQTAELIRSRTRRLPGTPY